MGGTGAVPRYLVTRNVWYRINSREYKCLVHHLYHLYSFPDSLIYVDHSLLTYGSLAGLGKVRLQPLNHEHDQDLPAKGRALLQRQQHKLQHFLLERGVHRNLCLLSRGVHKNSYILHWNFCLMVKKYLLAKYRNRYDRHIQI